MRDPRERLRDVLEAIDRIERYAARGRKAFEQDELVQSWFVRHLQIIGEAVRALPADVRDRAPNVPWSEVIGMRHILVHDYFDIDAGAVWDAIERDIPELKTHIQSLLSTLDEQT